MPILTLRRSEQQGMAANMSYEYMVPRTRFDPSHFWLQNLWTGGGEHNWEGGMIEYVSNICGWWVIKSGGGDKNLPAPDQVVSRDAVQTVEAD